MSGRDDLFGRYCLPGNRYKKLLSARVLTGDREQALRFGRAMADDGRRASVAELEGLLVGDWREAGTACWLIGFAQRWEFRPELRRRLLAGEAGRAAKGITFALARSGQAADAEVLAHRLAADLGDPADRRYQPWVLGGLLVVEERLGLKLSGELLAPDGPWERWAEANTFHSRESAQWARLVRQWVELAEAVRG
ncbi:DUF6000 family protein [Streptomyces sp. NPDC048241]|uniref:DUF6000 family protein n=1 Tax=Streptomyces sp. NPDC048241 TaxID=3365521 RepID=UPI0037249750